MSDFLGLPCVHGEDATTCECCWAPPAAVALCMRCEHVHPSAAAHEERVRFGCLSDEEAREQSSRIFCAHADQNGDGAHWKNEGDGCRAAESTEGAQ